MATKIRVIEKRFSAGKQISTLVEQENGNMKVLLPEDEEAYLKKEGLRCGRLLWTDEDLLEPDCFGVVMKLVQREDGEQ